MEESLVSGKDKVLCMENLNVHTAILGGGSHAFADPENRIAFAYTMNQMNYGVLPGPKAIDMVDAIYQ